MGGNKKNQPGQFRPGEWRILKSRNEILLSILKENKYQLLQFFGVFFALAYKMKANLIQEWNKDEDIYP